MTANVLPRKPRTFPLLCLMCFFVAPAAQLELPAEAAAPAAAKKAPANSYFCYSTDPKHTVVYFSDIFAYPAAADEAENFLQYMHIRTQFDMYLTLKHSYIASSEEGTDCAHVAPGTQPANALAQAMAAQKLSAETKTRAQKKQVVETRWKYTGQDESAGVDSTTPGKQAGLGTASATAQLAKEATGPVLVWHMTSKKDDLTGAVTTQPSAIKIIPEARVDVSATAYCSNNGVGVFFLATADKSSDPAPQFTWYTDPSNDSGDQVADVRMVVDGGGVHVAKGFANVDGHTVYTNWLGLLFYEPNIVANVARNQERSATTGIPALDGLIAPMVRQQAQNNSQQQADSSAGSLSTLVSSRSIRVQLPLASLPSQPVLDINPQDKVLHQFVVDCNAKFTGGRRN
jgi:hypothetical protein